MVVSGDFNIKIGNKESELYQNDDQISKGGRYLLDALTDHLLELMNKLHTMGPGRTHVKATAGTS